MKNKAQIRPAISEDIPFIKEIASATDLFPPDMLEDMIEGYLSQTKPDIWFVHQHQGKPISFGFCEPERMTEGTWNLLAIGVRPEFQGQGIGSDMIHYLERELAVREARILLVETMGIDEFERTREFYRKIDFIEEARIRDFYEAGADKVIFWKRIP